MFSNTYKEAREKFLNVASEFGYTKQAYTMDNHVGAEGEELTTDIAYYLPPTAKKVLIVTSGTHGVEGFYGSAMQTGWLTQHPPIELPEDTGILFIHAVNPYGFSHLRRVNEDNVDVNRNFLDFSQPLPQNSGYAAMDKIIVPKYLDRFTTSTATFLKLLFALAQDKATKSHTHLFIPLLGGQYTHPEGFSFGGQEPSWSNKTFEKIMQEHIATMPALKEIAFIDLHSGIGKPGELQAYADEPGRTRIASWLQDRAEAMSTPYPVYGGLFSKVFNMFHGTQIVTSMAIECGTKNPLKVIQAMRHESWLERYKSATPEKAAKIKSDLKSAFFPATNKWEVKATQTTMAVFDETLRHLAQGTLTGQVPSPNLRPRSA